MEQLGVNFAAIIQREHLQGESIKLAKQLLKRYDYSIDHIDGEKNLVPPFWIDMSRLYEVYVNSLLQAAYPGQIKSQVEGYRAGQARTAVDFLKMDEESINLLGLCGQNNIKLDYSSYLLSD